MTKKTLTLNDLATIPQDELIEYVIDGLVAQQDFAWSDALRICRYRDEQGNKCAIGLLIPDELYDVAIEGGGVLDVLAHLKIRDVPMSMIEIASTLQRMHDSAAERRTAPGLTLEMLLVAAQREAETVMEDPEMSRVIEILKRKIAEAAA